MPVRSCNPVYIPPPPIMRVPAHTVVYSIGESMIADMGDLRRCFQPRQWFEAEGEPDPFVKTEQDTFMWVYREGPGGKLVVGYFLPDGTWFAESTHDSTEEASARVNYLNGGARGR